MGLEKGLLNEVIIGYRAIIAERYDFDKISQQPDFPDSFTREQVDAFKAFFLEYLYPNPTKRDELNEAFEALDGYIKHPSKLFQVLMDSTKLLFKFGRHLPKIFKAGLKALSSFRGANNFENKLIERATDLRQTDPQATLEIKDLIKALEPNEIEEFIQGAQNLFETLYDRELVSKIILLMDGLIGIMKAKGTVYTSEDIKGLQIGRTIIAKGDALFAQLSPENQTKVLEFVIRLEREFLQKIFESK
ncbi:MAG: hypothetical protein ACI9IP_000843 [Arcticibacterium sp.]|jgi:hypothetical protein